MYGTAAQEAIIDSWVNEKESPYVQEKPFACGAVTSWADAQHYGAGKVSLE